MSNFTSGQILTATQLNAAFAEKADASAVYTKAEINALLAEDDNLLANPTMTGAAAGSPGTLPAGWSTSGLGGLTRTVSVGRLPDGRPYRDIRFAGTTTDTSGLLKFTQTPVTVTAGVVYQASADLAVVSGSLANLTLANFYVEHYGAASSYIGTSFGWSLLEAPTSEMLRYQQGVAAPTNTTGAHYYARFTYASGAAIDFTLRIVQPYYGVDGPPPRVVVDAPASTLASGLIWNDEFDAPLDLSTQTHTGAWSPNFFWQNQSLGYADFACNNTFNIAPAQSGFSAHNPFSVAASVLTITAKRTPTALVAPIRATLDSNGQGSVANPAWVSGLLITNQNARRFRYGYIEWRMRLPTPGRGMAPALWLYAADGETNPNNRGQAEIDVFETLTSQQTGHPWNITLHKGTNTGVGTAVSVKTVNADTAGWHNYGLDWQPTYLRFYRDGVLLSEVTGADATWFNCDMNILIGNPVDFTFNSDPISLSDATTPSPMILQLDYVRVYTQKP